MRKKRFDIVDGMTASASRARKFVSARGLAAEDDGVAVSERTTPAGSNINARWYKMTSFDEF